ncbi:MAG: septum formation initiator family protein [Bacteroidetes bacterium]|nr:septum formation initiator family protein [Bacteroidota bacterium]MBT5530135.1 septum formation initiator family protein [Cytophagia bacterium]MBT5990410.1 septum formation initiator family protein [Bacteroidota bacterium]
MKRVFKIVRNKFVLTTLIFIVWVGFIDRNNLVLTYKTRQTINELEQNRAYYLSEIEETKRIKYELLNNRKTLAKFARETYYMKKPGEEIFIVEEE